MQNLNFKDETFDLTFSTCLLAHLDDPLRGAKEAIRVTKAGGRVLFLLPSDPGVLNRLVKNLITYPKMRRQGIENPKFIYAMEHKNHVSRIITLLEAAAEERKTKIKYFPVNLPTWNFSLWAIASIEPLATETK